MRVTIDIKETSEGLVFKKQFAYVHLHVIFEQKEIDALTRAGVLKHVFYADMFNIPSDQPPVNYYVKDLFKGPQRWKFSSLIDAQEAVESFKGKLRGLKDYTEAADKPKSETFEL